jgi:hypothetical protein
MPIDFRAPLIENRFRFLPLSEKRGVKRVTMLDAPRRFMLPHERGYTPPVPTLPDFKERIAFEAEYLRSQQPRPTFQDALQEIDQISATASTPKLNRPLPILPKRVNALIPPPKMAVVVPRPSQAPHYVEPHYEIDPDTLTPEDWDRVKPSVLLQLSPEDQLHKVIELKLSHESQIRSLDHAAKVKFEQYNAAVQDAIAAGRDPKLINVPPEIQKLVPHAAASSTKPLDPAVLYSREHAYSIGAIVRKQILLDQGRTVKSNPELICNVPEFIEICKRNREYEARKNESDPNKSYFVWITVSPESDVLFEQLQRCVQKFISKSWITWCLWAYEQRAEYPDPGFRGYHVHILTCRNGHRCSHVDRETRSTFKPVAGCKAAVDIKYAPARAHANYVRYLRGDKADIDGSGHKPAVTQNDLLWRSSVGLGNLYAYSPITADCVVIVPDNASPPEPNSLDEASVQPSN